MAFNNAHYNSLITGNALDAKDSISKKQGVFSVKKVIAGTPVFYSRSWELGTQNANLNMYNTITGLTNPDSNTIGMSSVSNQTLISRYHAGSQNLTINGFSYRWSDWGNDIFDGWGYFYIANSASTVADAIPIGSTTETLPTSGSANQRTFTWTAFGKNFQGVAGYLITGLYRIMVTCEDPTFEFRMGAYGNMGSDSGTNRVGFQVDQSYITQQPSSPAAGFPYTSVSEIGWPLYAIRNYQSTSTNAEQFHIYYMPMDAGTYKGASPQQLYTEFDGSGGSNDDDFGFETDALKIGHIVYFEKGNNFARSRVWYDVGYIQASTPNVLQEPS